MKISLFTDYGALNSVPVFAAFAEGCDAEIVYNDFDADVAVIWSILFAGRMAPNEKVWKHFNEQKKPIIVLEVGALDRNNSWKVGINGINNCANFANKENLDESRWGRFGIELKPWREDGQFITIATQRPDSHQWAGMPTIETYVRNAVGKVREFSNREIVVRPHPRDIHTDFGFLSGLDSRLYFDSPQRTGDGDAVNFTDILSRSWAIINHSSGPAIQAAFDGTHIFTGVQNLAYPMSMKSLSDIENPPKLDRTQWLSELAHTEWYVDEIAEGKPWNRIKNYLW